MPKKRIAVFSPVNPVRSGISDYTEENLSLLAERFEVHLFIDGYSPESAALREHAMVWDAAEYTELDKDRPFSLNIYHLGNAPYHDYIYPFIYNRPGLLVLHDAWLQGTLMARALRMWGGDQYRLEMLACYGDEGLRAAEVILSGLHNQYFLRHYPMIELPVRCSLMTVVHDSWLAGKVREIRGDKFVRIVPLRMPEPVVDPDAGALIRRRYGVKDDAFLLGSFGILTPEKRIPQLLESFSRHVKSHPGSRLLLVGEPGNNLPLADTIARLNLGGHVITTGRLPREDFHAHMSACDAIAALRWPTYRESSAAIMDAMALGLPVIISDLAHFHDFPANTVIRVSVLNETTDLDRAIDNLADIPPIRKRIGEAAAGHVRTFHGADAVSRRWSEILDEACLLAEDPDAYPDRSFLPEHLLQPGI